MDHESQIMGPGPTADPARFNKYRISKSVRCESERTCACWEF